MFLPDFRTLTLAMMVVAVVFGLVMVAVGTVHRRYPGPRQWAAAGVIFAVVCLMLVMREKAGLLLTVLLANGLALAGFAVMSDGIHQFLGRPSPRWFYLTVCGLTVALLWFFAFPVPNLGARFVIYSLGMGLLLVQAGWVILRSMAAGRAVVYWINGGVLFVGGLVHFIRAFYFLTIPGLNTYYAPNWFNVSFIISVIILYSALMSGLVLMISSRLASDLEAHVADLRDEIGMRRQAEERLAREAALDPLTGIYNRRKFFAEAAKALSRARRRSQPLSLIILDIDHFKGINDSHGHDVGDKVLRALADFCQGQMRAEDTLARFGGEEFVVLLPDTDLEGAAVLAERLRQGLRDQPVENLDQAVTVTASFGVDTLEAGETSIDPMLVRADQALYQAKQAGRDQVRMTEDSQAVQQQS